MTRASDLLRSSDRQHLMLLYDDEHKRSSTEIECINRALDRGQFCVYATVDAHDKKFVEEMAAKMTDYQKHVEQGDLLIVDFMPFYESAAAGSLDYFNGLRGRIEAILKDRVAAGKSGKALMVADAACNLSKHGQFDECVTLERWWQDTHNEWMQKDMDVTIICAHPADALSDARERMRISHAHSMTIDLRDASTRPVRVLVAEPEQDMQTVYRWYLGSQAIDVVTVGSGRECVKAAEEEFDLVIVDTHLKDMEGPEVASAILQRRQDQRIVFTTTSDQAALSVKLEGLLGSAGHKIMTKPFDFSQLLKLVPAKDILL